ncbi:helix-turn-helix transcriptional regulator [Alsobacter sp. R-9]
MARAQRLLDLIDALRRHRRPVPGRVLADELGVSLRTLFRDIDALAAQGAPIDGEAGVGFVLRPGWLLPPLTFRPDEIEALVLGTRWVAENGDPRLATAARSALARIEAVLPHGGEGIEDSGLIVGPTAAVPAEADLAVLRDAIRAETKLRLVYDDGGKRTERVVWPVSLAFFERVRVLAAWCELRGDWRHFRTDRMVKVTPLAERLPRRRRALVKEWRRSAGLPDPVS